MNAYVLVLNDYLITDILHYHYQLLCAMNAGQLQDLCNLCLQRNGIASVAFGAARTALELVEFGEGGLLWIHVVCNRHPELY